MTKIDWTRINNDSNGNPRYVCHFLALNTEEEKENTPNDWNRISNLYAMAVQRAKTIGGKKYNNKAYGGGIVFQSYSLPDTEKHINRVLGA
jgi:hypothetical protein